MPRRNKFRPGRLVTSLDDVAKLAEQGRWFYMWRGYNLKTHTERQGRPIHPAWVMSLKANFLKQFISYGVMRVADLNTEEGTND